LTDTAGPEPDVSAHEVRRRFVLFFVPGALQIVLAFATLPLTTLILGPADFAAFSLIVSFSVLPMSLSQMGSGFVLSQHFRSASERERCRLVTSMTAVVGTSSLVLATIFVTAFAALHDSWTVTAGISVTMVVLVVVESIGASVLTLVQAISKLGRAVGQYSLLMVLKSLTAVATTLAALFLLDLKGVSLFVGHAAGGVVALLGAMAVLSRFFTAGIDGALIEESLYLGGWSTVSLLVVQARQAVERALLSRYVGLYELGLYLHAQQYQSLASLGATPLQNAVTPVLLDEAREKNPKFRRTARSSNVMFLCVTIYGVAAALFARTVIGLMTHGKFDAAGPYVALLVGVVLVQLTGRPQLAHLLLEGRGRYISLCNIAGAVAAVLTLFVLVRYVGLFAAVCANYIQFLSIRWATGVDPFSTARLPFQDGTAVVGLCTIWGAALGVHYFQPDLLTSIAAFVAFLAVVAMLARSTVADMIFQVRAHFTRTGRAVPAGSRVRVRAPVDVTRAGS
jgi:O-antigen/teichoic acid export membrane protein